MTYIFDPHSFIFSFKKPPDNNFDFISNIDIGFHDFSDDNTRNWKKLQEHENFYFNTSIVKCRINSFFRSSLIPIIKQKVLDMNQIAFYTLHFANFKLLYILHNNLPIPKLDQCFFYNIVSLVSTNSIKHKFSNDPIFNLFLSSFPIDYVFPSRDKICYMVSYLCQQLVTATKNHLILNFRCRFTKYLKMVYDKFPNDHIFFLVASIIGDKDFENNEENYELHAKFKTDENSKIIQEFHTLFRKPKNTEINIWSNLDVFIPFYKTMLDKFLDKEQKGFTLLPQKGSYIPSFVYMDTTILENMISIKTEKPVRKFLIDNDPLSIWLKNTNIKNYETVNRKFDYIISTNGYEVNIHLKTPKKCFNLPYDINDNNLSIAEKIEIHRKIMENWKQKKEEKRVIDELQKKINIENGKEIPKSIPYKMEVIDNFENYKNYIGLDPGKRNLFTTYDKNMQHLKCTGREYKHLTHSQKNINKINNRKNVEIKKLSEYSFKVNTMEKYIENLTAVNKLVNKAWEEYEKEFYRGIRFTKHQRRKKAYERLANRIEGIENNKRKIKEMRRNRENKNYKEQKVEKITIVGYGMGGSNGSGIKGSSMPIKGLYEYLKQRKSIKVVNINECYTSKKCHNCKEELKNYNQWLLTRISEKESAMKLRSVYGLRCCKSNKCRNATYDRDENASKNIYEILIAGSTGKERPEYLQRKTKSLRKHRTPGTGRDIKEEEDIQKEEFATHCHSKDENLNDQPRRRVGSSLTKKRDKLILSRKIVKLL